MHLRRHLLTTASAICAVSMLAGGAARADGPVSVVATFSVIGDMVERIGGDLVELETLVGPDGDAHVYQPTPQNARAVQDADVMIVNGLEFEGWLDRLAEAADFDGTLVVATTGIDAIPFGEDHDEHHDDEHAGHDDHGHEEHAEHDHEEHAEHDDHDHDHEEHAGHDQDHDKHGEDHAGHDDHGHHGHGAHAFEWGGLFDLEPGTYSWSFAKVGGEYADPAMRMVVLAAADIESVEETAEELLEADAADAKSGGDVLVPASMAYALNFDAAEDMTVFSVSIEEAGTYAFFTEHMPFEFEADEHFFKDVAGVDVEPIAQEPEMDDHDHGHHGHHHGEFDPHAWQTIENAIIYVDNITAALAQADPSNAGTFYENRAAYVAELEALDEEIHDLLDDIPEEKRTVVTSHDAFGYFTVAYDIEFLAPVGLSTESEASAADVAELITQIREEGISAVFVENITDSRLVEQIASETGVTLGGTLYSDALSGADGPAATYIDMMRHNAMTLSAAIGS